MAKAPTTPAPKSAPVAPAPATTTGAKPESLSAPDAGAPAAPSAAPAQDAAPAAAPTSSGTLAEMEQAERAVLGQAPASGDTTAQERPVEQEGTRMSGPAAVDGAEERTHEGNDFAKALEAQGEREPLEVARELIKEHGSLVRSTAGTWSAPNAPTQTGVTGVSIGAPFVTDTVVAKLLSSGDYEATATLRGRPRTIAAKEREEPAENVEG